MKFIFKTNTTMKKYNYKEWWIDNDIIPEMRIDGDDIKSALKTYQKQVDDKCCIKISDNALKSKVPMCVDTANGAKQVGYVITASTDFDNNGKGYVMQYIDLWVEILTLAETKFEEI